MFRLNLYIENFAVYTAYWFCMGVKPGR